MKDQFRRFWKRLLTRSGQYAADLLVLGLAFVLAYLLRFEFALGPKLWRGLALQLPLVVLLQFSLHSVLGVYTFVWRYIGMAELGAFLKAALFSGLVLLAFRLYLPSSLQELRVPISVIGMDAVLAFCGVLGLRVLRRAVYERDERQARPSKPVTEVKAVLLVGAGQAGVLAAAELSKQSDHLVVKGFVDDDPAKVGAVVRGYKVLGTSADIPRLVPELGIDHVIVTIASASSKQLRRIVEICESASVKVRIIPGLWEILEGKVRVSQVRDVEVEDLLGRAPVHLDGCNAREFLAGKVVMVTGAGGSIGSEICRQVASLAPAQLLLVERAEFALFDIWRKITERWPQLKVVPLVIDVGDGARVNWALEMFHPEVIFHAAAHKHVPLMEMNACEAVKNNLLATYSLAKAAGASGVEAFVFISTDKAVRPRSVMGATKRAGELLCQAFNASYPCRFVAVRFGNVLGSSGSVIPIFREQIAKGGPVTVTDPNMIRYFMSVAEAVQLVLEAAAIGRGGEIMVLDMGEPVRILELAEQMIRLAGFTPYEDIPIVFTGIRPGEKLEESLGIFDGKPTPRKTAHAKIFVEEGSSGNPEGLVKALPLLAKLVEEGKERELRMALSELIPEAQLEAPS